MLQLGDKLWVAAADMLVAGHHFREWAKPEDVGYKAVAVNVSDVAAMGAVPRFILVAGGAEDSETALRCFRGVLTACEEFGVYPLGGDTTGARDLTVDVAILGELEGEPVLRSGAQPGDALAVTGELGAAAAGLLALESGVRVLERLVAKQLRPAPRVEAGLSAARLGARAMIDLSDGLAADIRHLCEQSGVGCRIELNLLPVAGDTAEYLSSIGQDPHRTAATGGEDYELLLAAPPQVIESLARSVAVPLTVVGEVTASGAPEFTSGGRRVEDLSGWDHFS